jgi:signal peptidase II
VALLGEYRVDAAWRKRQKPGLIMRNMKHLLLVVVTVLSCVGCDQLTKATAREYLADGPAVSYIHGVVRLQYAENPGAFLSLGETLGKQTRALLFTGAATAVVLLALGYAILKTTLPVSMAIGLSLICGGGIGNLIDRFWHDGHVVDFLYMGIGSLHTGIFNLADVAITAGAFLLVISGRRRKDRRDF